jgi:hypothetical protein
MKLKLALLIVAVIFGALVAVAAWDRSGDGPGREYCPGPPRPCYTTTE